MNVNDIVSSLMNDTFSNQDLERVAKALRYARAQIGHDVKRQLRPGITVKFFHPKQNFYISGTVNRVKQKYVLVDTAGGRYNVPANLLETA